MALAIIAQSGNVFDLPATLAPEYFRTRSQNYKLVRAVDATTWRRLGDGNREPRELVITGQVQKQNVTQINTFLQQLETALNTAVKLKETFDNGFARELNLNTGGNYESKFIHNLSFRIELKLILLPKSEVWTVI